MIPTAALGAAVVLGAWLLLGGLGLAVVLSPARKAQRAQLRAVRRDVDRVAGGRVISRPGHRCAPPSSHEWAGGELKVQDAGRYPDGTKWRCACGRAWWSTYGFRGLWLRWERDPGEDEIPDTEEAGT